MSDIGLARAHYAAAPKAPASSIDVIWETNLKKLQKIITEAETPEQAIRSVNQFAFYDFTCKAPLLEPAVRWYGQALIEHYGIHFDVWPFEESELVGDDRCVTYEGRRVSADMMYRCLTVAAITRGKRAPHTGNLRGDIPLHGPVKILEIGGGYGSLARTIMGLNPKARYTLVDLSETLFFAELFLRHSFPDKTIAYADESGWPEADIVLVPSTLRRLLTGQEFDLAINTNSFGEMPRDEAKGWLDWLVTDIRPAKLWSLNRFLNRVDTQTAHDRRAAMGMNFLWGPEWRILDWEVNPVYERCPYYMSIVTRNLHIVADLDKSGPQFPDIADLHFADWHAKPSWSGFNLVFSNERPIMAKGWPDLTPDLTMSGPLYALWEARRHGQDVDDLLRSYLDMLTGGGGPFEEHWCLSPKTVTEPVWPEGVPV